jgi:ribosomal protein S18 acetylase RimI-like enzyme
MTQVDLPGVLAVASSGFGRADAQRAQPDFNDMFSPAGWRPFFYVAENHGNRRIVGLAGYAVSWLNYGVYELFWVGVLEEFRGMGAGKALVSQCLSDLAAIADQVILATDIPDFYAKNWKFAIMGSLPTTLGSKDVLMVKDMRPVA